jgi:V8-like Glu-specific endopeptidase
VATEISLLFDDLAEAAERAATLAQAETVLADSAAGSEESARDSRETAAAPHTALEHAAHRARAEVLTQGARGLQKLSDDATTEVSADEAFGIEAIVLLQGRPALLVQHGDFPADLPPEWAMLNDHRGQIQSSLARVGRIEVVGHPDLDWVGTGFLVADDIVMTNRHVAHEFARHDAGEWRFLSGRSASLDLLEELGTTAELEFDVTAILGVHESDDVDLALLRVGPAGGGADGALPSPVSIAATSPENTAGRTVYTVGYPAWDGRRNEPEEMSRIFSDIYNVKRLQPGFSSFTESTGVFRHDCSTLGGNSGSAVFDLHTHRVLGLHFGGRYGVGNYAVPLWTLVEDPLVAAADLNFEDDVISGGEELLPWPESRRGDTEHPVRTLQYLLRASGRVVFVDGIFGPATEGAVRAFQRERRLAATGSVGVTTWDALVVVLAQGARGDAVRALQEELRFRRYGEPPGFLAVDGIFGPVTAEVVRTFQVELAQQFSGVEVDGTVGPTTWQALVSGMLPG